MRIFYELSHTSCDVEIMKSGFDFDVLYPGDWDERGRRKPSNARLVRGASGPYAAAVVSSGAGLSMVPDKVPVIWKCFVDFGMWPRPPQAVYKRLSAWTALCDESSARFGMEGDPKAVVIEPGINVDLFKGYKGSVSSAITVGHLLPDRPEKGPSTLREVSKKAPMACIGVGNEAFKPSGIEVIPHASSPEDLVRTLRTYRVYFNPSSVICCAVLEAMSCGIPVVTMKPGNFVPLMLHRENCMVAESADQAAVYINLLLKNPGMARDLGKAGAESVRSRFHSAICAHRWRSLISDVVDGRFPA